MSEKIRSMLSEKGSVSSMRLMSFLSLTAGIFIGAAGLFMGKDLSDVSILVGVFVGSAFSGKAFQKFAEVRSSDHE